MTISMPRAAALGFVLGAAWGVLARVWMRLIAGEPEFTWAGTLSIIGSCAVLGLGVGLVHGARRTGRSAWWTLAVVPGLLTFMSPGMLLAPCFLLGGLAWGAWGRAARVVGVLAVVTSVGVGTYLPIAAPEPGEGPLRFSDVLVYEVGYLAMALTMAAASSLVWQRTRRPDGPPADVGLDTVTVA